MYRSYMHVDMGARRSWIAGQGGIESKIKNEEKLEGEDRTRLEIIESIHEADAWRQDKMRAQKDRLKVKVEGRQTQEVKVPEREVEIDGLVITSRRGNLNAKGEVRKSTRQPEIVATDENGDVVYFTGVTPERVRDEDEQLTTKELVELAEPALSKEEIQAEIDDIDAESLAAIKEAIKIPPPTF